MSEPERYWGRFEDMYDDVVGSPSDIEFGSHGLSLDDYLPFVQAVHYDALRAENERLRKALEFYAREVNYLEVPCDDGDGHIDYMESHIMNDAGHKARAACAAQRDARRKK